MRDPPPRRRKPLDRRRRAGVRGSRGAARRGRGRALRVRRRLQAARRRSGITTSRIRSSRRRRTRSSFGRTLDAHRPARQQHGFDVIHAHLTYDHWLARSPRADATSRIARTFHARRVLRSDPLSRSLLGATEARVRDQRRVPRAPACANGSRLHAAAARSSPVLAGGSGRACAYGSTRGRSS